MTSRRTGLARRLSLGGLHGFAAAALFLVLASQVGSTLHFLLVFHALDPASGHVVGCAAPTESTAAPDRGLRADAFDRSRGVPGVECPFYVLLSEGRALQTPVFAVHAALSASARVFVVPEATYARTRRLYLLAPSTSPPRVASPPALRV